jgi:DNA-binding SARP family transcriptional activator
VPGPDIRLLGPLEVAVDGQVVDLGGPRQRAVLALLLVAHGEVVSVDRLIDDLWRGEPPPRATGALQAYVSNLRRALEPERAPRMPSSYLVSAPPGYAVRISDTAVDAWHFEQLLRAAADLAPDAAAPALEQALGLWRGPALAEFAAESWAAPEAARLGELRLIARERLVAARIGTGRPDALAGAVAEAELLVRELPLREEGWRLLALGQYLAGRQGEALGSLRRVRRLLSDELGVDPGPALRALEQDVLAQAVEVPAQPQHEHAAPAPVPPLPEPPPPVPSLPGSRPDTVFVGRAAQRAAVRAAAAATVPGTPGLVLVAGEAGGGKSALLAQVGAELRSTGWRVTVGRCPEDDSRPPAWAWTQVLRDLTDAGPAHADGEMAPLLHAERGADNSVVARFRLHTAVRDWLATFDDRPLAVLLDDVHRADFETRSLLTALVDQGVPQRALFVLAYRPEPDGALDDLLATLAGHDPVRLRLAGLADAEIAELVEAVTDRAPSAELVEALAERTEGNPFFLKESARLLRSEGELVARSKVPEGVADVLRRRLARLPEESVSILRLAAVIGRDVDVAVLSRAAEVDEDRVLDALETGLISGLLVEPGPGTVRFAHVVVRETLYAGVPQLRRVRWHARVADAIAELYPGELAALAHHTAQAATPATGLVAAQRCTAAAEAARAAFAFDTEADLYAEAQRCTELVPGHDPAEIVRIACRRVPALIRSAASVEAVAVRADAIARATRIGDPALVADALACGTVLGLRTNLRGYGEIDRETVELIGRTLEVPGLDDRRRCRLLITLVRETSQSKDPRCEPAFHQAVELARRIGDDELIGLALVAGSEVSSAELRPADRRQLTDDLAAVAARTNVPVFDLLVHTMEVSHCAMAADLDAAREHVAVVRSLARRFQLQQGTFLADILGAMVAHQSGDLDLADRLYLDAFGPQLRRGTVDAVGGYLLARATVRHTQGRLAEMRDELQAVYEQAIPAAGHLYVLALTEAGDLDRAREVLPQLPEVLPDFLQTIFHCCQALAVVACGETERAQLLYERLTPFAGIVAGSGSNGYVLGPVARVLGKLAVLLGRTDDARAHFARARAIAERCGSAPWLAQLAADVD